MIPSKPCPCGASTVSRNCKPCERVRKNAFHREWYWRAQAPLRARKRKLTSEQAAQIKQLLAAKQTETSIAAQFGISRAAVNSIRHGRGWKRA